MKITAAYPKSAGEPASFTSLTVDELKALLEKLVHKIWKHKAAPQDLDKALTKFFAGEFWKAIEQGYGVSLEDIDFDSPDNELLKKLRESVFQFSAAKNHAQMKALSQALIDETGTLRSFSAFRFAAMEINNEFVDQWLRAEYNFAVASAQSASQWQTIQATKDVLPLLQYRTVGDERVRPDHLELEGVIRPVEDPFWDMYYPPNGWNCRCDVYQLSTGKITPLNSITLPDLKPIFQYNPGKAGVAFPPGHPYYDGLPESIRKQATDILNETTEVNETD